jgi:hypothetical protein
MGKVAASGYNQESGSVGERAAAPKVANYAREYPVFGGFHTVITMRHF